jgi:hypothetical protein
MTDQRTEHSPRRAKGRTKAVDAPGPVPEDNEAGHRPDVVSDKPLVPPDPYRVHDRDEGPTSTPPDGVAPTSVRFPFLFEPLLVPAAVAFGVTPLTAWVVLDDEHLEVRFGPWSLATERDNLAGAEVTGPYHLLKVAGPPHISLKDRGVTFATTRRGGVCIRFHRPVPAALPVGLVRHPAATVTVTNPADLARRVNG